MSRKLIIPSAKPAKTSSTPAKNDVTTAKTHTSAVTQPRTVSKETAKKWKNELAIYNVHEWLSYSVDKYGHAIDLKCKFCIEFVDEIKNIDGFNDKFVVGSKNYRKSSVEYHAKDCAAHTKAYELHLLREKRETPDSIRQKMSSLKHGGCGSSSITDGIEKMNIKDLELTKKKFEAAYFVAKEELPLTKYEKILNYEAMHGVSLGETYRNRKSGADFIEYIGVFIGHLEKLACDNSIQKPDQCKIRGYLKDWKKDKVPILLAMFIDLLQIAGNLSLTFQYEKVDHVSTLLALEKAKKGLTRFKERQLENLPHVKHLLSKVIRSDGSAQYQGIKLKNLDEALEYVRRRKNFVLQIVSDCMDERLENETDGERSDIFSNIVTILNCEGWNSRDEDFADKGIEVLYTRFIEPLSNAGVTSLLPDILSQWHTMVAYAVRKSVSSYLA